MDKKQHKEVFSTPVFPIPPAFTDILEAGDGLGYGNELDLANIAKYVHYLELKQAKVVMTTEDVSSYNLLSFSEILQFNRIVVENFSGTVIVGVPAYDTRKAKRFVEEFEKIAEEHIDKVYYMWLYPEKYYSDKSIIEYFFELTNHSKRPCLFHGKPLKHAIRGQKADFEAKLINKLASHPNIVGMKEDSSHMAKANDVLRDVDTEDFAVIVRGDAMSKFESQYKKGVCSYSTGMGSMFPEYALNFYDFMKQGLPTREFLSRESDAKGILWEVGWHLGIRTAIQEMGIYEPFTRAPFPLATDKQRKDIKGLVEKLAAKLNLKP